MVGLVFDLHDRPARENVVELESVVVVRLELGTGLHGEFGDEVEEG